MKSERLTNLLHEYKHAAPEFKATKYWISYEEKTLKAIQKMNVNDFRSGRYPELGPMGFADVVYYYHPHSSWWKRIILKFIHNQIVNRFQVMPYGLSIDDIREMSYHHCELEGKLNNAKPISSIGMDSFGKPSDIFEINNKKYSVFFLQYYLRYCFAHSCMGLRGDEIIVELGSGSGYQVEILKKLYPNLTILCFDLPCQIFLCETYLSEALKRTNIVSTDETIKWPDLSKLRKAHVHFFGNWQIPLIKKFPFDIFWNASSFGEMEPKVVNNYLSYIKGNAKWIYLLQARHGKEIKGKAHVEKKITFEDYNNIMSDLYILMEERDVYNAHRKNKASGGYFEAVWKKKKDSHLQVA